MTTDVRTAPTTTPRRDTARRIALAAGLLYLVTFAASIPQLALFADLVADPAGFVLTPGSNTAVLWGSWLEVITALSGVGTALALYPVTRRVSRIAALGFVTSRVVEAAMILVGVLCVLSVVALRSDLAGAVGAQADALGVVSQALVEVRQWSFLVGPGLIPGINALFLGYVMYRSRLVPRIIPTVGLVGAPLILLSATVTMLGGWEQVSLAGSLCALPIALWELSLGVWLTVKGFRPTAITSVG
ncbi:hypothetical protein Acsp06_44830 [Actinomycetospora sp. NBRC 106375]|uniref:DUF4386 domain-containing protein n=1 Tax=Actinomycetospora sp. NBRC 106375 TaxID=3032207 RepID=UPI0024A4964A|nr:DUF4386 domain-containing protein [Actinomycetospora sp. NBRC 106375]GLZ48298.1 hypothetical protein Acsp06_44830 [Actinomycetospora sp. NBRC 106375]